MISSCFVSGRGLGVALFLANFYLKKTNSGVWHDFSFFYSHHLRIGWVYKR